MKILLGVDESPFSRKAVDFVKSLHWPESTTVVVMSAVQLVVTAWVEAYGAMVPDTEYRDHVTGLHTELVAGIVKELEGTGLKVESRVVTGDPRIELVEMARKEKADLVVVGSHGRTGIAKLLVGSVASHVMTHAPCSVLVVKDAA